MVNEATCSVETCDRPPRRKIGGLCAPHYERQRVHGDLREDVPVGRRRHGMSAPDRYADQVDERGPDECWPWTGYRDTRGYGKFHDGNRAINAHRYGYMLRVSPVTDGIEVCHRCDNPPCQNPAHLFLGTRLDNARDMAAKGRTQRHRLRLTDAQVGEIRERFSIGETDRRALGAEYGVTPGHIWQIVTGKRRSRF